MRGLAVITVCGVALVGCTLNYNQPVRNSYATPSTYAAAQNAAPTTNTPQARQDAAPAAPKAKEDDTPPGGWKANKISITPELQGAIEEAVRGELKDPDSAKFKHYVAFRDAKGGIAACGVVNAKNSYGGYVGDAPFRAFVMSIDDNKFDKSKASKRNVLKYIGVGAVIGGGKYVDIFYSINAMCSRENW